MKLQPFHDTSVVCAASHRCRLSPQQISCFITKIYRKGEIERNSILTTMFWVKCLQSMLFQVAVIPHGMCYYKALPQSKKNKKTAAPEETHPAIWITWNIVMITSRETSLGWSSLSMRRVPKSTISTFPPLKHTAGINCHQHKPWWRLLHKNHGA